MKCCQHFGICGRHHVQGEWDEGVCRSCSAHRAGGVEQGAVQCDVAQKVKMADKALSILYLLSRYLTLPAAVL
jgi:hypothetical protein